MGDEKLLEDLYAAIVECDDNKSEELGRKALEASLDPDVIIETGVNAITQVGRNYEDGKIFLPELMLAGMALDKVMSLAKKKILQVGGELNCKGVILIGAVKGDVHTIGKDLVATMWRSKGFEVHDLGVDVPASRFVSAAQEFNADIVGLSALMSTTLPAQKEVIEMFELKGVRDLHRIIVGGGVCTQEWADKIGADGYAEDAARAMVLVEKLVN
ncbi:MAG: cobalamin-dependent protein [Planctomycetota bacterium]